MTAPAARVLCRLRGPASLASSASMAAIPASVRAIRLAPSRPAFDPGQQSDQAAPGRDVRRVVDGVAISQAVGDRDGAVGADGEE